MEGKSLSVVITKDIAHLVFVYLGINESTKMARLNKLYLNSYINYLTIHKDIREGMLTERDSTFIYKALETARRGVLHYNLVSLSKEAKEALEEIDTHLVSNLIHYDMFSYLHIINTTVFSNWFRTPTSNQGVYQYLKDVYFNDKNPLFKENLEYWEESNVKYWKSSSRYGNVSRSRLRQKRIDSVYPAQSSSKKSSKAVYTFHDRSAAGIVFSAILLPFKGLIVFDFHTFSGYRPAVSGKEYNDLVKVYVRALESKTIISTMKLNTFEIAEEINTSFSSISSIINNLRIELDYIKTALCVPIYYNWTFGRHGHTVAENPLYLLSVIGSDCRELLSYHKCTSLTPSVSEYIKILHICVQSERAKPVQIMIDDENVVQDLHELLSFYCGIRVIYRLSQMEDEDEKSCQFCHIKTGLSRCSRCKIAHYCSREHQALHWPIHKKICNNHSFFN
eukprot:gene17026-23405_t